MKTSKLGASREVRAMLASVHDAGQDMREVERAMITLAGHAELFAPAMRAMPAAETSATWLVLPDTGPRLALVHRPAGHMSAVHSHHVWVCLAPIAGAEQHEVFRVRRHAHGHGMADLISFQTIETGHAAHLIPPGDVHSHGHLAGTGPAPYTLVLLGDNMLTRAREEYDRNAGTWRRLVPGDAGATDRALTRYGT